MIFEPNFMFDELCSGGLYKKQKSFRCYQYLLILPHSKNKMSYIEFRNFGKQTLLIGAMLYTPYLRRAYIFIK